MWWTIDGSTVVRVPRRGYIDPEGYYHVGSRGVYGRTLFANKVEHEVFLLMFTRVALKYRLRTLTWALMKNHHHFVLRLTDGGLSEAMRELHGGYSRWRHEVYGQTRLGHLVRHAFFARELEDGEDVVRACVYVDLNPAAKRISCRPRRADWSGYASTLGLSHPRPFHSPSDLLELLDAKPAAARSSYRRLVENEHAYRKSLRQTT
jgi:REP element-mobilizing transposase RayT